MKYLSTLTTAAALLIGSCALGHGADLNTSGLKDASGNAYSPIQGFYGEAALGYGFSQGQTVGFASAGADLAATGALFNLRAGYDKVNLAGRLGAGVYAEGSNDFNVTGSVTNGTAHASLGEHWSYGAGAKGFYDYGTGQTYVLAGWEGTDVSVPGGTQHLDGVMWGIGINTKLTKNLYAKVEFDQVYYGTVNWTTPATGTCLGGHANCSLTDVDNRFLAGFGFTLN
jgi:hypothetical protein